MKDVIQNFTKLVNPQCSDISFLQTSENVFSIFPITIIMRPWLGRHHVYGIFKLPSEHQLNYPVLLSVKGAGKYRKEACMVKVNIDTSYLDEFNYYTLRVHLKTRVALWMIIRGLSHQILDPTNWTLSYTLIAYQKEERSH
ncbi:MAG: hypothetical protein ACFB8W_02665 [Elainellaceae cyanobacterium]